MQKYIVIIPESHPKIMILKGFGAIPDGRDRKK